MKPTRAARAGQRALGLSVGLLLLACAGCHAREDGKERKLVAETLLELDLTDPPPERAPALLGEARPTHFDALLRLRRFVKDPLARGVFARLGSFGGHFGDVDDWAEVFEAYRAEHKPVHCQFDELDNAGYALASHCDKVSMTPAGLLNLVGLALQSIHGRELLDLVGVKAELFQAGKYKGAAEPFTRDAPSPEQRESLEALLSDLDASFRAHLAKRRQRDPAALQHVLEQGPYTADRARQAGLVDAIAYDDEARAHAKKAARARLLRRLIETGEKQPLSFGELFRLLGGARERPYAGRPHLGVAFLTGEITDGAGHGFPGAASDPFVKALRRWGDTPDVRAVLLRVESPGGSALASDRMWHAVTRVARRKPVIVSLGDMAASGGYYVASAGSTIVAAPGSIVGSIGVVGGKVVLDGLADRVGVHVTTLSHSTRATWLSAFQPFSADQRQTMEAMLQNTYARFLERVAQGRKRQVSALLPAAEGRVMAGERARKLGLVDEVGGLARAVTLALQRGKLPADAPVETWPDPSDPLETLSSLLDGQGAHRSLSEAFEASLPDELAHTGKLIRSLASAREQALAVLPFALSLR